MDHITQIDFTDLLQDLIPMLRSIFLEISNAEPSQVEQLTNRIQALAQKDFKNTLKAHYYLSLCHENEGNVSQQALLGLYALLGNSSQVLTQQDILQLVDDLFSRIPTSPMQSTIRNIWMDLKRNLPHVVTEALILEKIQTLLSGIQDNNEMDKVTSHWLVLIELVCLQPEALDMVWARSIPKLAAIIEKGIELAENIDSVINPLTLMTIMTKTFDYLCTMDLNVDEIKEGLKVISTLICKSVRILSVRRGNEDLLNSVFESFDDIFGSQNFQSELKEEFFWQILTVIEQEESRPSCIDKALELLCSYASSFQVEVRRSKRFINTFFTSCFSLLCNVPLAEEEQWLHLSSDEINQYNDETVKYGIASSKLDEFSTSIGQSLILESCTEAIKSSIKDSDWKIRHAGYSLLSIISEACKQAFSENKQEVLQLAASGVVDEHPQVQEAGIRWLALFISALSPEVPREYHNEIIAKLMSLILPDEDTSTEFKIKTIALSAMVNTFKGLADSNDEEVEDKDLKTKFIIHSHMDKVFPVLISMLRDTLNSSEEVPYSKSLINEFQVSWLSWIDLFLSIYDKEEYPCEEQKFDSRYFDQIAPLIFQVAENSNVINGENPFGDEMVEDWCRAIGFLMHAISDDHIKCMQVRPVAK